MADARFHTRVDHKLMVNHSTRIDAKTASNGQPQKAKPTIDASNKDLSEITPLAWSALARANVPVNLFRFGGIPSRIETGDEVNPVIKSLDFYRMRHEMARVATWIEWRKVGDELAMKSIAPPKDVVNDVLATPNHPLPILTRVVEAPVFAANGTIQLEPGYHADSRTFYAPAPGFKVPRIAERPTGIDLETARILICDELLGDFPFVGESERAHAVAFLLLPFARDLIDGPTPLHLFEKPTPGTGATLCVDMLSFPATGRPIPTMSEGRDEDEWRKRLTAKFRAGSSHVYTDNLRRRLDSAAVSAAITSTTWEDRVLGFSEMTRLPVRAVWGASGNNPGLSTEMSRRTIRIRMDAKLDRPWTNRTFKHENLRAWAEKHRGELVRSALTLIRAWIVAGRPKPKPSLGMFERWSEVIGGILETAKIPGFLGNLSDFYDESDAEGGQWRAFLLGWWEKFADAAVSVKDLWAVAAADGLLQLGDKSEQSQRVVLGKMLADRRDRIFDLEIEAIPTRLLLQRGEQRQRAYQWRLRTING